jgi:hypothetical protein
LYSLIHPTNEQCEEYINRYRIADGKYRVNGIIRDYEGAIKYICANYFMESAEFTIVANIATDSGFCITH